MARIYDKFPILNGKDPGILYDLMDGAKVGTYFAVKK
jgi:hypothetical protein